MDWKGMIFLRFTVLIIAIVFCAAPALAQETSPLRRFVWDLTPDEVRKVETGTFYKSEGDSDYYVEPFKNFYKPEFYRTIRYDFQGGKLWRGQYSYDALALPDPQLIFDRAADFQIALEKLYGKPSKELLVWKNEKFRRKPRLLGAALREGHLEIRTVWDVADTQVVMRAYNDGTVYQLTYTAEKPGATSPEKDKTRNILDLPLGGETTP